MSNNLETPNQVHGRLLEGVHLAGYSFERACTNLEWLIEENRWREVGAGYDNVNDFLANIRLDQFRVVAEQRKRLVERIKQLQPEASNRAIAQMVGVDHRTVDRDVGGENSPPSSKKSNQNDEPISASGENSPPPPISGAEAAQAVAGLAARQERKARKEAAKQQIASAAFSDDGPFGTVVIDPPWDMEKIDREVAPNQVEFDYPVMTGDEIGAFWFGEMARRIEPDCHLFMWTTQKFLPATFKLIEAFGFRYVFTMVWHKSGGFQPFELAQYNCEFVICARRGTPIFISTKDFPCCFDGERREHSRKPDRFYDIVRRVTGGSRIDVFAREAREGFARYGNEIDKFTKVA